MAVLHFTGMNSCADALDRLCDPDAGVSAHYVISETGAIWRLVAEERRAWHAGAGAWGDVTDVNSRSVGIELVNPGAHPFPEPQMTALEELLGNVVRRWRIPPERVIGHADMAPLRKADPGPRFDWRRLARRELAVWAEPRGGATANREAFRAALARFGYPQAPDETLLRTFRDRFRPWASGPLDPADVAVAAELAARFPVRA